MKKVKLSLIVPAYNVAPYLQACISSIVANSFQNYELLLIDDGSTDETGLICDKLAQEYDKITVFHTDNRGVCSARNLGLEHAVGEYIGFVDADDLVAPRILEALVGAMDMDVDVQLAACSFTRCTRDHAETHSDYRGAKTICTGRSIAEKILCGGYGVNVWNKLFRQEYLKKYNIRFRPDCACAEDQYFTMDYLRHCRKAVFLDSALYFYIMNPGSIMNSFRESSFVNSKYVDLPRSWRYTAEAFPPSDELAVYSRSRAVMFYQTVLRKLEAPDPVYIEEAVSYVRKYKSVLRRYRWGWKYYLSAIILSIDYKFWASICRKRSNKV